MSVSTAPLAPAPAGYDVVLRHGSTVRVRPVAREDAALLHGFLVGLSDDGRLTRFGTLANDLESEARRWADVDGRDRYGLVALAGPARRPVAHAAYVRTGPARAEVGFAVADDHRGLGLATLLLAGLAEVARPNGIRSFEAYVLRRNGPMAEVLRDSGFAAGARHEEDFDRWELATDLTAEVLERYDLREASAAEAALRPVLSPRSVAVVGASRTRGTIGSNACSARRH